MKKWIGALLFLVMIPALTVPALANSAPSHWEAYPSSEVLVADEDCPVVVNSERLTFNFSGDDTYGNHYAPAARVTADYEMYNPTNKALSVQMEFPFVASLAGLSLPDITIQADGKTLPYEVYLDPTDADMQGGSGSGFSYGGISNISKEELVLAGFDLEQEATLCRFEVDAGDRERIDFQIRFHADAENTILIASGFNGYTCTDDGVSCLSARTSGREELELLVLGEEPAFTSGAYADDGAELSADSYGCTINQSETRPKEYLLSAVRNAVGPDTTDLISDTQLFNVCLSRVWRYSRGTGFAMLDDTLSALYSDRVVMLVYTVEFPAQAARRVSVGYLTDGAMDRTETVSPKYSYTYFLSPAQSWAHFGRLDIEIMTPEKAPYLIESSLPLPADGRNRYAAQLDGLPDGELTFTLYEKEKITWLDSMWKAADNLSYLLYFFLPLIAVIIIIIAAVKAVLHRRRRG